MGQGPRLTTPGQPILKLVKVVTTGAVVRHTLYESKLRSRSLPDIIEEAGMFINKGIKELVVIGQIQHLAEDLTTVLI